jgi:putative transcription antitermination factor YqgF
VKILALDYGSARTGVAVSDPTWTVARPVGVVERAASAAGLRKLRSIVEEEAAEQVVVGMPYTLRGERGEQARETEEFVAALRSAVVVPVVCFDERFTSVLAEGDDAKAAAHLLLSYLEWSGIA